MLIPPPLACLPCQTLLLPLCPPPWPLPADGVVEHSSDGRTLLELEDLARACRHPCIIDIKVGFRTWYPQADGSYIQRCK